MGFMTLHGGSNPAARFTVRKANSSPDSGRVVETQAATAPMGTYVVPSAIAHSTSLSTVNPGVMYLRNPFIGGYFLGRPQPRSSFSLPVLISMDAAPTDTTLFEDPADAGKQYYLPKYKIAVQGSGGAQSVCVTFAAGADGFDLIVQLADATDPSTAASNTAIVPTTTRYMLSANLDGRSAVWDFTASTSDSTAPTLTLTVTDPGDRDSIYRAMTDPAAAAQLVVRRSFDVATDVASTMPRPDGAPVEQPLFRERLTAIDSSLNFTFDPTLDKAIFASLGSVGSADAAWNIKQVPYAKANRSYPYYQDASQPAQIYYLPDAFKISRLPSSPHAPSITVSTIGNDPTNLTFTLTFVAVPVWNPDRIVSATTWWQDFLHAAAPPALYLFEASNTALSLTLPTGDGSGAPALVPQAGAVIDIATGIKCSITLTLTQFQQVYAALFDEVSQLLSGVVTVTVASDVESIPFTARAADFAGAIVDTTTSFDAGINQFHVFVTDSIESPIQIDSLSAKLMKGPVDPSTGQQSSNVQEIWQQVAPKLPAKLAPQGAVLPGSSSSSSTSSSSSSSTGGLLGLLGHVGDIVSGVENAAGGSKPPPPNTVVLNMQLTPGQNVDPSWAVVLDLDHTHVVPDSSAIWDSIMSNQVVGPVQRNIKVMAFKSMFEPPSGATGDSSSSSSSARALRAVQIVFESGQTLDFDSSTAADASGLMAQSISLAVPVKAYVLGTGDTSIYRYHVDLITAGGMQQGQWMSSNADSFYVQSSG